MSDSFLEIGNKKFTLYKNNKLEFIDIDYSDKKELLNFVSFCKKNKIKFKTILDPQIIKNQNAFYYLFELVEKDGVYIFENLNDESLFKDYKIKKDSENIFIYK